MPSRFLTIHILISFYNLLFLGNLWICHKTHHPHCKDTVWFCILTILPGPVLSVQPWHILTSPKYEATVAQMTVVVQTLLNNCCTYVPLGLSSASGCMLQLLHVHTVDNKGINKTHMQSSMADGNTLVLVEGKVRVLTVAQNIESMLYCTRSSYPARSKTYSAS